MQKQLFLSVSLVVFLFLPGCQTDKTVLNSLTPQTATWVTNGIYRNSFESSQDTVGWRGFGTFRFEMEAPPGGGKQSLYVSGACTVPHAYLGLPALTVDGNYLLRCWGRNLQIGGSVALSIVDDSTYRQIYIMIDHPEWRFYQSADTLFCPAGKTLRVELSAGGIVASAMLVDFLEIVRVK